MMDVYVTQRFLFSLFSVMSPMSPLSAINPLHGFGIPPGALSAARIGLPLTAALASSVILVSNLDEEVGSAVKHIFCCESYLKLMSFLSLLI